MDYVASMEPPSGSAGALKSTGGTHPWLWGQVTLFMSPNGDTSHRPSPLCAAHLQTMHQNIKSIHPHYIPVHRDERYRRKWKSLLHPHWRYTPLLLPGVMSNAVRKFFLHEIANMPPKNADWHYLTNIYQNGVFNSDIITFRILWAESLSCSHLQINATKSNIIAMLFTMSVLSFRLAASGAWMHPIMLP